MGIMASIQMRKHYPYKPFKIARKAYERCGFLDYVKMEKQPNNTWNKPSRTQGPTMYGLGHPYCSDLAGFTNNMYQSDDGEHYMEYLVVEYAQDVENQTPETETTQETTALYLKKQLHDKNMTSNDNVCVLNTGIHDQNLCRNLTHLNECEDAYLQNVASYLKLLDPVCGKFIWIGITPVRGDEEQAQRNNVSTSWNEGVRSLGSRLFPTKLFYIDVWNTSSKFEHKDNVHFADAAYYQGLAGLFTKLMV